MHGQANGAGSSEFAGSLYTRNTTRQSPTGAAEPRGAGIGWQTLLSVLFELRIRAKGVTDGRSGSVTVVQQCNSDLILEKLPSGSDLMEYTLRMLTSLATSGATP